MTYLSIVCPVYGCSTSLIELYSRLTDTVKQITDDYEIILVNDASPDNAWEVIEKLCEKDKKVKGIHLSRNFGQHYAITAGLNFTQGEWVVVMDCDLQDKPEEISRLYQKAMEGYDSVFGQRKRRKDKFLKRLSSKLFYQFFSYLTETKQDATIANFGIYHRHVIDAVLSMGDQIRYFPTMVQYVGFRKAFVEIEHLQRDEGESAYNFKSLFRLALNNIIAFSDKPLRLTVKAGFIISLISLVLGLFYIYKYLAGEIVVLGFASLIISIWFLSGIIISITGVIGLYVGKMFEKVKDRPVFFVEKKLNV
jgi:polyisoprenyl-phosphate glycosyltransferase